MWQKTKRLTICDYVSPIKGLASESILRQWLCNVGSEINSINNYLATCKAEVVGGLREMPPVHVHPNAIVWQA